MSSTFCKKINRNGPKPQELWQFKIFNDTRATRELTFNWGFDSQIQISGGGPKNLKIYQVDMFWKNWEEHDASVFKSIPCKWKELYEEIGQNVPILLLFRIFRHKKLSNFYYFVPAILYVVLKHCANFYLKLIEFTTSKV